MICPLRGLIFPLSAFCVVRLSCILRPVAGVDPELLPGGGANPQGGHLPNILVIFSEKTYKNKEILVRRGHPLNLPLC